MFIMRVPGIADKVFKVIRQRSRSGQDHFNNYLQIVILLARGRHQLCCNGGGMHFDGVHSSRPGIEA